MPEKRDIHTVPIDGGGWQNIREGVQHASKNFDTKAAAQAAGRDQARRDKVDHVSHNLDRKIGEQRSYGHDPNPPKDRR